MGGILPSIKSVHGQTSVLNDAAGFPIERQGHARSDPCESRGVLTMRWK